MLRLWCFSIPGSFGFRVTLYVAKMTQNTATDSTITDFALILYHIISLLGFVYTDAVSNRNGFMTWKPHRKRHGLVFTEPIQPFMSKSCPTKHDFSQADSRYRRFAFLFVTLQGRIDEEVNISRHLCLLLRYASRFKARGGGGVSRYILGWGGAARPLIP